MKRYVGEFYQIEDSNEKAFIGTNLPEEYTHSSYMRLLKGTNVKSKTNAVQGIPELLEIATNEQFEDNRKEKHNKDAKYDLRYLYSVKVEKLKNIVSFM